MVPVDVHEHYRDYTPPPGMRKRVRILLERVPDHHLQGLGSVVLTNTEALSRNERRQKTWSRGKKVPLRESAGWYEQAWNNRPASIRLVIDNAVRPVPLWVLRLLPFLSTLAVATVLYHEVGHHIHATTNPQHRQKEDVADEWGGKLQRGLLVRRYWYLIPVIVVIGLPLQFWMKRRLRARSTTSP